VPEDDVPEDELPDVLICPDPPPVTVVLDEYDDVAHTRAALAAHDPAAGCVTVHPTPGTDSGVCLAYDLLAALGKPVPVTGYRRLDVEPPWAMAAAWVLANGVTRLTVLRAHLLHRDRVEDLLTLRSRTGVRLVLVCHRRGVPAAVERALAPVGYRRAQASAVLPGAVLPGAVLPGAVLPGADGPGADGPGGGGEDRPVPAAPQRRPLAGRWLPLSALTTLAADDDREGRCRCAAPAAEARGFRPPGMRPTVGEEIARRLQAATAHPHLAAELATAVFTAASTTQLDTVHLRDLAPDAATVTLHDPRRLRQGCMTHPVPPWARPFLLATAYLRRIAAVPDEPLFAPPFPAAGLPHLTAFAETCRLRPPQPRRPRKRRGTRRREPPRETVWPLSAAHYRNRSAVVEDMQGCPSPPSWRR
jgi:hypothetical protein